MITRALYLALGWFVISMVAVLLQGKHWKKTDIGQGLLWFSAVLFTGGLWAFLTFGIPVEIIGLAVLAFLNGLYWIYRLPDWNVPGKVAWANTLLVTLVFMVYSFTVTIFTPLSPLSFVLAVVFFFVEALALLLSLTHAFESLNVISRVHWRRVMPPFEPTPDYQPKVSLQVPTYNEPPEMVEQTLRSLAKLDYPNYEVLVIDNNTPDQETWRPLEEMCRQMGPRFRLIHLDQWPGFKSGALNFALTQTAPDAEIIGVVDADYQIEPNFLKEIVPGFRNPAVAFVQTPQDYRDSDQNTFARTIYHGYKYFFEVSMPVRNEYNAIIFCGTMGLLRRSALEEIGGWDEWCITEDAEASLRILKRGYESIYVHKTYGRGLMPFTFEGLKKQRFRWGFGGIQILRMHWEKLVPWAKTIDPSNRLTASQRYFYLAGGLQWFTDVFNLLFTFFLILGAVFSLVTTQLSIRPLTQPLMVIPSVFLLLSTWRFVWVLREKLHLSFGDALRAMYGFFSLGWTVSLASIQGLVQSKGIFLRTPKSKGDSKAVQAIRATSWETAIGVLALLAGIVTFAAHPAANTAFLALLLIWQSSLYLSAPAFSLMSIYTSGARGLNVADMGAAVRESMAARWAIGMAVLALIVYGVVQLAGSPPNLPSYARYQPGVIPPERLVGIEKVPVEKRGDLPTPANKRSPQEKPTKAPKPDSNPPGNGNGKGKGPAHSPSPTQEAPVPTGGAPIPTGAAPSPTVAAPTPTGAVPTPTPMLTIFPTAATLVPTQIEPTATPPLPTAVITPAVTLPPPTPTPVP